MAKQVLSGELSRHNNGQSGRFTCEYESCVERHAW